MKLEPKSVLLIGASLIVLLPFIFWWVLRLRRIFPLAAMQIFTGIALGPSILGYASQETHDLLFGCKLIDVLKDGVVQRMQDCSVPNGIKALAAISVCLFAFLAGTEADRDVIRNAGRSVVSIGVGGLLLTWLVGIAAGYQLALNHPSVMGASGLPVLFAIAFGLCNAVPALPILALIMNEVGLSRRRIGAVALAAAALGDAVLWSSMAVILPFAKGAGNLVERFILAIGGGLVVVALCLLVINPILNYSERTKAPERVLMILVGIAVFVCSALTEVTGLHAVLGAFVVGAMLPDSVRHVAASKLDMPTSLLLLPFFFLDTGLQASISISQTLIWTTFAVGMAVCVLVKLLATILFARLSGENTAFGFLAGILLQTKGLMELVVVTVFKDVGIVSVETYSALVLVALASTALTMPICNILLGLWHERIEASGRPATPPVAASAQPVPLRKPPHQGPRGR
jgi:Kef-type K+ transport system membrane component KefB